MAVILPNKYGVRCTPWALLSRVTTDSSAVAGPSRKITDLGVSSSILQFILQVHGLLRYSVAIKFL